MMRGLASGLIVTAVTATALLAPATADAAATGGSTGLSTGAGATRCSVSDYTPRRGTNSFDDTPVITHATRFRLAPHSTRKGMIPTRPRQVVDVTAPGAPRVNGTLQWLWHKVSHRAHSGVHVIGAHTARSNRTLTGYTITNTTSRVLTYVGYFGVDAFSGRWYATRCVGDGSSNVGTVRLRTGPYRNYGLSPSQGVLQCGAGAPDAMTRAALAYC